MNKEILNKIATDNQITNKEWFINSNHKWKMEWDELYLIEWENEYPYHFYAECEKCKDIFCIYCWDYWSCDS